MAMRRRHRRVPVRRLPWSGSVLAVTFVGLSVLALALVPIYFGHKANEGLTEISEILDPARLLGTRLSLVQARQMSAFQAFLLTGSPTFRQRYLSTIDSEREIYEQLTDLVMGMKLDVRKRLVDLSDISNRWHLGHQEAMKDEDGRQAMISQFDEEQQRYLALQQATLELESAIQGEVEGGRQRIALQQKRQTQATFGLLALALASTLVVGLVGWRLHALTAEAELRRSDAVQARREYDAILEATADGVLGLDLDGRIISLNRAGTDLLGYTERELEGRDFHDTLHHTRADGSARPRATSPILRALEEGPGGRVSAEDVLRRRDGSVLPVQWSLRPLVDGLEVRGAVLTFTDMTLIREKENALRRAVRVREEVVSVVSHDLRNPLGVVAGAADLLLDLPLGEAERIKQADIIRRSAQRMGRLIQDLLDVARIEAGALVVRPVVEGPKGILDEIHGVFAPQAEEKGVELEVDIDPGIPPALVDADRIHQALSNLVANALKFTPSGGKVTLSAHEGEEGWIVLSVSDTGPGIPDHMKGRLFDRFWQASRHDRTGSGLGLAIVRGIAEAHGGSVEVLSKKGAGATFSLRLRAATERMADPAAGRAAGV
jgi:PAS domain S-box-containing protein